MNGRFAMLACAGILLTELGGLPLFTEAGEAALKNSPFDLKTLVFIQVPFMAWFEYKRWDSWQRTGEVSVNGYEPWDPSTTGRTATGWRSSRTAAWPWWVSSGSVRRWRAGGRGPSRA